MARARLITRTLGGSRRFHALADVAGPLGEFSQLLFTLLVVNADDFGRLAADGESVKFQVFPSSHRSFPDFEAALTALDAVGLIGLYDVNGQKYLQVNHFEDHQWGLTKRTTSKIPVFPGKFQELPGNSRVARARGTELNRTELKGTEGKRTEEELEREANRDEVAALSQGSTNEDGQRARKSSAARAARYTAARTPSKNGNVQVITKMAHEVIDLLGVASTDLTETVKSFCARRHVQYDSGVVRKAIDSAMVQRRKRR